MRLRKCLGGCVHAFMFALALDVLGLIFIFVGVFANLRVDGRFYGDFLIYTGSLIIFFSLGCWLMWYVGNVPVSEDAGPKKRSGGGGVARLARRLTARLSQKLRGEEGAKRAEDGDGGLVGPPPSKAGKVTWGKATAHHNEGYDDYLDSPAAVKKVETEKEEKPEI